MLVALAVAGAGYWALVLGGDRLRGAALAAVIASPVKLRLRWEGGTLREYAEFSVPLFISTGAGVVIAQSAVFVGQAHLGLAAIGVIALAASITSFTDRMDRP